MSARVCTSFSGSAFLTDFCAIVREQRAVGVVPGSEQEIAWHAIVPADCRRISTPPLPAVAGAGDSVAAAEQPSNPS